MLISAVEDDGGGGMALLEDEEEVVLKSVTNYYVLDDNSEPASFSLLPLQLGGADDNGNGNDNDGAAASSSSSSPSPSPLRLLFLHGSADGGLQKVYKPVVAWKLDIDGDVPVVSLFSREGGGVWIQLLKPRKSFEDTIRSVLISAHALHFLKRDPSSHVALWPHLAKVFGAYDVSPSVDDLLIELGLVKAFLTTDPSLSKSEFLLSLMEDKLNKRIASDQLLEGRQDAKRPKFIVPDEDEDDDYMGDDLETASGDGSDEGSLDTDLDLEACVEDDSDEASDLFDSVCAICDNGGDLLCCEGKCMRSFHATKETGSDCGSDCVSLGMSPTEVEAVQNFYCANCKQNKHQCFSCGKLGSSDPSANPEVFLCANATCGHFYHPPCVARLLFPSDSAEAEEVEKKIASGEAFTCPVHRCLVCKQREDKTNKNLHFAICRRCPKAYHRMCLPKNISFDASSGDQRAWDDLIPKRILIYCRKHKIEKDIGTPIRDHLIFPDTPMRRKATPLDSLAIRRKVLTKKKNFASDDDTSTDKIVAKKLGVIEKQSSLKGEESVYRDSKVKLKTDQDGKRYIKGASSKPSLSRLEMEGVEDEDMCSGYMSKKQILKPNTADESVKPEDSSSKMPIESKSSFKSPSIDKEMRARIKALINKSSTLTLDDIIKRQKLPSTYNYSRSMDKTITLGKVEGSVEALRTALQKLEEGASIEDAEAVCEPEIVYQIIKWQNKLKVYLAPFLHGMRYTSYGRHFTKKEKLQEVVGKLHWYVQNGDMIVDFCCGANDFSVFMKEKLLETGKRCLFKNYDIIQPKNDFCFEKKDWMKVEPADLLTGSKLVMGLNPPFGVRASLANKFVKKALEFRPRILLLIVPEETERLEGYDLIWEDGYMFSGKTFYLPGSVDVNDKQMEQWNVKPPHLYLWSRPDWTDKYRTMALQQGHIEGTELTIFEEGKDAVLEESNDYYDNLSKLCDLPREIDDDQIPNGVNHTSGTYQNSSLPPLQTAEQEMDAERAAREEMGDTSEFIFSEGKYGKQFLGEHKEVECGWKRTPTSTVRSPEDINVEEDDMNISDVSEKPKVEVEQNSGSAQHERTCNIPDVALEDATFSGSYSNADNLDTTSRNFTDRDTSGRWTQPDLDFIGSRHTDFGTYIDSYSRGRFMDLDEQRREETIRRQLRLYGRQVPDDFVRRRQFLSNHDSPWHSPSVQFGLPISEPESFSRRARVQHFPPGFDDRNYVEAPAPTIDPRLARASGSLNFASAPRRPFSFNQGSSGWLND